MMNITIIGEGAWGRALGFVAKQGGHKVQFWSRQNNNVSALENIDAAILAVPAQAMREVLGQLKISAPLISAAKGFEQASGKSMAELAQEIMPQAEFFALSGPSFAADVVAGLPTAVTLAGNEITSATHWAKALSLPTFRIYPSDDVRGVEIGGALKNVLAIACGISDGQKLGESARASLITRGFAELCRYGKKLGAKPETLMGLSGFGDLQLTCSSMKSRNYGFGLKIGKGLSPAEALQISSGVVEGAATATIACKLAAQYHVEMPIVDSVAAIVEGRSNPAEEIKKLLSRPIRVETQ
jgi:glycerol-3-phosphate dehydrogenase (NAD(P)+)